MEKIKNNKLNSVIDSKKVFEKYVENYDLKDEKIKLKITHTYEVVKLSEYIARELNLDEENIELAKIIALLHDIGRFEQFKRINSFNDNENLNFEHGNLGVEILFEDDLIREFIKCKKYDNIIYKAILNHNKYSIEDNLNEIELLHAKIIRDADKLDILRKKKEEKLKYDFPGLCNEETLILEKISDNIYNDFMSNKCIKLEDVKTQIDYWVCVIAFIFDFNFDISLKYIKVKNYIDILVDKIEYKNIDTKNKMEQIRIYAKKYIENKIHNNI